MGTGVTFQIWSPDISGALGRDAAALPVGGAWRRAPGRCFGRGVGCFPIDRKALDTSGQAFVR